MAIAQDRMGVTRRPLARIYAIHEELARDRHPNCQSLSRALEVSAKTVMRDIDFMRDEFRLPIAFDTARNGYHYTEPVTSFPPAVIRQEELMALFVARKMMEPLKGTALEQVLRDGFQRLSLLSGAAVHLSWAELDQAFSVREAGIAPADLHVVELLSTALVQHQKVFVRYLSPKRKAPVPRVVHPYHLSQFHGGWYLFAHDERHGETRIFALQRMDEVELLPDRFPAQHGFRLDDYLRGSFGLITDPLAQECEVLIRFVGPAAAAVRERRWHASQKIENAADGSTRLRLRLQHLDDLLRWVLGWGDQAEVLAPPALRKRLGEVAQAIANQHREPR